ncbi:hypothetical protein ColLi_12700 [Colletotrichum liriopes]|uniref:Uncharacterized protein n=1 Tax=Colletotrichum liriopes TaxID=708192 RepID=A0AA37LYW7_9PEZI|nr:hypothetical protein ColLi_12700 [Colletotrichum liriopes]
MKRQWLVGDIGPLVCGLANVIESADVPVALHWSHTLPIVVASTLATPKSSEKHVIGQAPLKTSLGI